MVPLLNGLEHVAVIRNALGRRVAAASIARIEAFRTAPTRVAQRGPAPLVTAASADLDAACLARALEPLGDAGVELRLGESEAEVLWEKAARLAVLAPATALAQRTVGEVRADPAWRPVLRAADRGVVRDRDGRRRTHAARPQWEIIDSLPSTLTTSAARDVAAGVPSELDAITGAVVRAGARLGVPCPALTGLYERCRAR